MSNFNDKPAREIDLDKPGAEVSKLFVKLPQTRIVRTAQDAIMAEDSNRPVTRWFPESMIASYTESEVITK